jgi:hypothetical protein
MNAFAVNKRNNLLGERLQEEYENRNERVKRGHTPAQIMSQEDRRTPRSTAGEIVGLKATQGLRLAERSPFGVTDAFCQHEGTGGFDQNTECRDQGVDRKM